MIRSSPDFLDCRAIATRVVSATEGWYCQLWNKGNSDVREVSAAVVPHRT